MENFKKAFGELFSLHEDSASMAEIIERIHAGGILQGTNMCILVLAIFIASIGLNMNSTAVIIGAMLISPLMGNIIAIGYGRHAIRQRIVPKTVISSIFVDFNFRDIFFTDTDNNGVVGIDSEDCADNLGRFNRDIRRNGRNNRLDTRRKRQCNTGRGDSDGVNAATLHGRLRNSDAFDEFFLGSVVFILH